MSHSVPKRIAIATCKDCSYGPVGDAPLVVALEQAGCTVEKVIWNQPGVAWDKFDACVIRSTWDWHLDPNGFREWVSMVSLATALYNPLETLLWGFDKFSFLTSLARTGISTVPSLLSSPAGLAADVQVAREHGWGEVVIKPTLGASGYRTQRAMATADGARGWLDRYAGHEGELLIQPYLPHIKTQGEVSMVYIDSQWSHAVRKVPASHDFRVQTEHGGTDEPTTPSARERELAELCVAAVPGRPLYVRVDLVSDDAGMPCVMECEVVEPELYLNSESAFWLASALLARLES